MVHTAFAHNSALKYLEKTSLNYGGCSVGLILGQPGNPGGSKQYLIHLARTPTTVSGVNSKIARTIDEISDVSVADHAKIATRMLSGGMFILGVFIVADADTLTPFSMKLKSILMKIQQHMDKNPYICGSPPGSERLLVNYNRLSKQITCKMYDMASSAVKPAEFKIVDQSHAWTWRELECHVDLGQVFPILDEHIDKSLRKHMETILKSVKENLDTANFLYDEEFKENSETIEAIGRKKKSLRKATVVADNNKTTQITILLPLKNASHTNGMTTISCGGLMRVDGHLTSKLYLHPTTTVELASKSAREDIIRSLAVRLEMHCDSLTEEETNSIEVSTIHEPPRRVLVALEETQEVLNDYLFPGEGTGDVVQSLEEVLDSKPKEGNITEIEGQADIKQFSSSESQLELPTIMKDTNRFMYYVGAGTALLVLLVSVLLHLVFNK